MRCEIESHRQPDGRWIATVAAVPGLAAFGDTREESLASAKILAGILMSNHRDRGPLILGFYLERVPAYAQDTAVSFAS